MREADEDEIPVLTEVVAPGPISEMLLESVQAELTARILKLSEELVHNAVREMEAVLLERVCDRLRAQLPQIIDEALRAPLSSKLK